ncbi:hypothetical protein X975_10324, partial [Stegodyphus mimosarum]
MAVISLIYNMDHLAESDQSESNLPDVAIEAFGDDAREFMDKYTRQKERHRQLFEGIFAKYENMKESGLKIRLSEIPDRTNRSRKPLHVTKVSEISSLSTACIDSVKRKIKSANVTKVAEISDLSTAGYHSAQKKSKPASITKVHKRSDLSVATINSGLNVRTENWNEELPTCTEYDNQVVKETRSKKGSLISYAVFEDSRIKPKLNVDKSSRKEDVPGNQSLKRSRFKKRHALFLSSKLLKKHPSKDSGINMLVDSSVSMETTVKYKAAKSVSISQNDYSGTVFECSEYDYSKATNHVTKSSSRKSIFSNTGENFKCVNNVNKSVNTLAKSWNSNNRFKKHLWHGIVPVCSLSILKQTSPRSALVFSPVSTTSPISRQCPLPPQTL